MIVRACAVLLLLAVAALGEAGVEATVDFVSEDVFRGVSRRQGVSLQPSISYDLVGSLTAGLWANVRLGGSLAVSEVEYSLEWRWLRGRSVEVSAGWIYYDVYRGAGDPRRPETGELFAGLALDAPGRPTLYLFYDYDTRPGAYWQAAASHQFLLPDYRGTIDVSGSLGFETGRRNGFHDARASVSFSRFVGDWTIEPGVDLHFPADEVDPSANGFRAVLRLSASRRW